MTAPWRSRTAALAVVTLLVMVPGPVAQEAAPAPEPEPGDRPEAAPDDAAPGKHHEHLARFAGSWDFTAKLWLPGREEPEEAGGTISAVWVLGDRFLKSEITSTLMGRPYQGLGIDGYDNGTGHYVASWVDTTGTAMASWTGECENDGRLRTMTTEVSDPASGETRRIKGTTTVLNDNSYIYESFVVQPDGTEVKRMELVARRRS